MEAWREDQAEKKKGRLNDVQFMGVLAMKRKVGFSGLVVLDIEA